MTGLYWENLLFANKEFTKFSLQKQSREYLNLEERMIESFEDYELDTNFQLIPKQQKNTINFHDLKNLLLSPANQAKKQSFIDCAKNKTLNAKFLDEKVKISGVERVIYSSVPRSGNSFLRKLFEQISGVSTGSDVSLKNILNLSLQQIGFKGEEIVSDKIWICKSHFPLTLPDDITQSAAKVVICTRNPIDVIVSEFNCLMTWTHGEQLSNEDFHIEYSSEFDNCMI